MRKIRTGDEVIVIAGKDKGRRGRVSRVIPEKDRVIVDNVNMVKRHTRGNPMQGTTGGIIEKEAPIHISNVAIYNPETEKADRVGVRQEGDRKVRYFKSNQQLIDA
ncbi:50S ribosomal protein L24 [Halorhodospira halophila]|uniref:Large ribosomal subunit protein uL24 n=1 Tax=Halorhodospira halophila (strain DSM 244 / SL1) TaxID=349124 RepID=RL24_HALHL|nr:50S ribosomal protein L24 [Halorhodospira halophila]A1WVB1.1 RecName: Full=Large ribosomal subunit protein uL24; AltName: Full=50S ribosomal protein L24 [Halorhodospira halophila SL1]ABM61623.1 LSU ribosomal protein L24P [Halorhodospira halophila SL1]MBK1729919.1 50S ribosomal protein L24 [Halorhodospira halophila]